MSNLKNINSEQEIDLEYKDNFYFPKLNEKDVIYFCGHSLGLQTVNTKKHVDSIFDQWKLKGINGYFEGENPWIEYHEKGIALMAPIVGAKNKEIALMNTLSVNLHLMLVSFYKPRKNKRKILIESHTFPSDIYAIKSHLTSFYNYNPKDIIIELKPRKGEFTIRTEDILSTIQENSNELALIILGGINYYTGQFFDIQEITRVGHENDCIVGLDLAHAVGNVPLELHKWHVDFAVWCTYKYLNSGPGNIGGCFIHEKHCNDKKLDRLVGWWGNSRETRFKMEPDYILPDSAQAWQISCPSIINLASLIDSLELINNIGMTAIREKSIWLTGYLEEGLNNLNSSIFKIITPPDPNQRGAMLSIHFLKQGEQLYNILRQEGIYCDWRNPDLIRISCNPLYNSKEDIDSFLLIFKSGLNKLI